MDDTQAAKVIRFPGKHKEMNEAAMPDAKPSAPVAATAARLRTGVGVSLLAIALATVAVNRYAYRETSVAGGRTVASMAKHPERDAAWERSLAERLAQPGALTSPAQLGRGATPGEELRYGLLEDRYVIDWRADQRQIRGVRLGTAEPVVVDAEKMLSRFGSLFSSDFRRARKLSPAAPDQGRETETYELVNDKGEVLGRAILAYDAGRRLISIENTPVQL